MTENTTPTTEFNLDGAQRGILQQIEAEVENLDRALALVIQRANEARRSIRKGQDVVRGHFTILHTASGDLAKSEGRLSSMLLAAGALGIESDKVLDAYRADLPALD